MTDPMDMPDKAQFQWDANWGVLEHVKDGHGTTFHSDTRYQALLKENEMLKAVDGGIAVINRWNTDKAQAAEGKIITLNACLAENDKKLAILKAQNEEMAAVLEKAQPIIEKYVVLNILEPEDLPKPAHPELLEKIRSILERRKKP